jgi:hypothetical protein
VKFYSEYNATLRHLAECGMVKAQTDLPAPTALHALERALWQWSRTHEENMDLVGAALAANGVKSGS